jgi:DNA-binding response OmpR family regulator
MTAKLKVLVVEDEIPVAMMMVAALTHAGFDVTATHNGQNGLELATARKFDLITLDVDLPDIGGFEICRKLKQASISRNTPVVFVSPRSSEQDIQRASEVGAVDYIVVPFEATDFIFRIASQVKARVPMALSEKDAASLPESWAVA